MKFIITILMILLASLLAYSTNSDSANADYCLDLEEDIPKAIFVKSHKNLEPAFLNIQEDTYFQCETHLIDTVFFLDFFQDTIFVGSNKGMTAYFSYNCPNIKGSQKKSYGPIIKFSPIVQMNFPKSGSIIFDNKKRKKEDLLQFENKIIDAWLSEIFICKPNLDTIRSGIDTIFYADFRVRIIGECKPDSK